MGRADAAPSSMVSGHVEVAMTWANLAVLEADQGHWPAAEVLGRRSLRILEAVLGLRDRRVSRSAARP